LKLPQGQLDLINALTATSTPVVVVLVEGRPRVLNGATDKAAAVFDAYLPGPDAGIPFAELLFGLANPSGHLPITYPRNTGDILVQYYRKVTQMYNPQWEFGTGLSYTTFEYSRFSISATRITPSDTLVINAVLENTGSMAGHEVVMLYLADEYRSITPEVKMLKRFQKIPLGAGESTKIQFTLNADDLSFYGVDDTKRLEPGTFTIMLADFTQQFTLVM